MGLNRIDYSAVVKEAVRILARCAQNLIGILVKVEDAHLAVIGLGYVGLPLAAEFAKKFPVIGFDIDPDRVHELQNGIDRTNELHSEELQAATHLTVTDDPNALSQANVFIITAPTPISESKQPDLTPLLGATRTVAEYLVEGDVVIFESTVYPGATEEDCVPLLEMVSGLTFNKDFFVGYSPERINPGDKEHRFYNILKVTSGSTPQAAEFIDDLYRSVVVAGTHLAPSIRVAEAAKVIENTQRDVNIALMNELAILFNRLGIDTDAVLAAARTKWNFLPFRPGLVGGHCIGVDPYYLTHKAQAVGHHPEIILAGRRLNDNMSSYVASQLVKAMIRQDLHVTGSNVLILGLTFKENTPDLRNTRVIDIVRELTEFGTNVEVHDPWVSPEQVRAEFGDQVTFIDQPTPHTYDAILLAVAHQEFVELTHEDLISLGKDDSMVVYDLKHVLPQSIVTDRL